MEKSRLRSACEKIRQLLLKRTADGGAARLAALTAQQIDVPELRRVRQLVDLQRGALHGYAIAQTIHLLSDEVLRVEEGSLYPALRRVEDRGWVAASWGLSENNRRAKFYTITRAGRKHLEREAREWQRTASIIARFFAPGESS